MYQLKLEAAFYLGRSLHLFSIRYLNIDEAVFERNVKIERKIEQLLVFQLWQLSLSELTKTWPGHFVYHFVGFLCDSPGSKMRCFPSCEVKIQFSGITSCVGWLFPKEGMQDDVTAECLSFAQMLANTCDHGDWCIENGENLSLGASSVLQNTMCFTTSRFPHGELIRFHFGSPSPKEWSLFGLVGHE